MTRRQRSRRERQTESGPPPLSQSAYSSIRNPLPALTPLSEDQLQTIHNASLKLLAETGMEVTSPHARTLYQGAGAEIEEGRELVKLPAEMVMGLLETVPSEFTLPLLIRSVPLPLAATIFILAWSLVRQMYIALSMAGGLEILQITKILSNWGNPLISCISLAIRHWRQMICQ